MKLHFAKDRKAKKDKSLKPALSTAVFSSINNAYPALSHSGWLNILENAEDLLAVLAKDS